MCEVIGGDYSGSTGKTGLSDAKQGRCDLFFLFNIYQDGSEEWGNLFCGVRVGGGREECTENSPSLIYLSMLEFNMCISSFRVKYVHLDLQCSVGPLAGGSLSMKRLSRL